MEFSMPPLKLAYLAFFLLVLSMTACKTVSVVHFQALEAPRVVLPSDVSRIAFVDRNMYFSSDSINQYYKVNDVVDDVILKDSVDLTSEMTLNCYEGFRENISEYLQQDSIPFVRLPVKVMPDTIKKAALMKWIEVDSICNETESDLLIVMENIQTFNKHDIVGSYPTWLYTEIMSIGLWRIYDPVYQKVYDERYIVDTLFMETKATIIKSVFTEKLPARKQMLNDAAYEQGRSYVGLISPRWVDVSRKYFVSGDKRLSAAHYFMSKNEFDSAINIWESLIGKNDLKLAGRAAYNLAVVHEMKGDLKNARGWIRKAIYFYKIMENRPDEYKEIEAYSLVLNSRWVNGKKIKRFFGEE